MFGKILKKNESWQDIAVTQSTANDVFDMLDTNDDRQLDANDAYGIFNYDAPEYLGKYHVTQSTMNNMFNELDTNRDGQLNINDALGSFYGQEGSNDNYV